MKKTFILMLTIMFSIVLGFSSCTSCGGDKNGDSKDSVAVDSVALADTAAVKVAKLVPERIISTDRQDMFLNYKQDYRWYETQLVLKDWIDAPDFDGTIEKATSVFQVVDEVGQSADVHVVYLETTETNRTSYSIEGFWIEDSPMNDDPIVITYEEAWKRLQEANIVKPHSKKCVLRNSVGPKSANAQWVFGNIRQTVFVDAKTGEVSSKNPAFNGPLGEWP